MQTIVLEEPFRFQITQTQPPEMPEPGQALVRVRRVGICGTDLHAYRGRQPFFSYPRILGHELGVEVIEAGANEEGIRAGDKCSVEPYFNCGNCIACRNGKPNCCVNLKVFGVHIDGGMCEAVVLPTRKLHASEMLTLDQLALVETLGIGAHAVSRANVKAGEIALVIGSGPIGLATVAFVKTAGARAIVMDLDERRLEFSRRQFKVDHTIRAGAEAKKELEAITGGDLPTAVFDAT